MKVVVAPPPNLAAIDAAFNVAGKPILFAFGDKIYNPAGVDVPPELMAHEQVHGDRQGNQVEAWWARYIADPQFRLAEELPAHVAEFKKLCELQAPRWTSQRSMRRVLATAVARKLASPLYGRLISLDGAKRLILAA